MLNLRGRIVLLLCISTAAFLVGRWSASPPEEGAFRLRSDERTDRLPTSSESTARGEFGNHRRFRLTPRDGGVDAVDLAIDDSGRTEADVREMNRLHELRKRGDYVLDMEDPAFRAAHRSTVAKFVMGIVAERRRVGYTRRLQELGVPEEQATRLAGHIAKIAEASVEANQLQIQLLDAQQSYDKALRASLSEEDYRRYLEYESSLRTAKEVEAFSAFLNDRKTPLAPEYVSALADLFQATGTRTVESMGGPYDPPPVPKVGATQVRQHLESVLAATQRAGDSMAGAAVEHGLPAEVVRNIDDYFRHRREILESQIKEMSDWESKGSRAMREQVGSKIGIH